MTETLLRDLETGPEDLEAQAGVSDRLHRLFVEEVRGLVKGLVGSARLYEEAWQQCVREVATGGTERIQALRDRLNAAFTRRLTLVRETHRLARLANEHKDQTEPLNQELVALERLRERVFERWQTAEDLENLAVRDFPLPQARLQELARQYPPPQTWYDEESKPF